MPIYEFVCKKCGRFDDLIPFSKIKEIVCPKCSGKVKRILSSFSPVFKGTGFYETDYKKKKGKKCSECDVPDACEKKKDLKKIGE